MKPLQKHKDPCKLLHGGKRYEKHSNCQVVPMLHYLVEMRRGLCSRQQDRFVYACREHWGICALQTLQPLLVAHCPIHGNRMLSILYTLDLNCIHLPLFCLQAVPGSSHQVQVLSSCFPEWPIEPSEPGLHHSLYHAEDNMKLPMCTAGMPIDLCMYLTFQICVPHLQYMLHCSSAVSFPSICYEFLRHIWEWVVYFTSKYALHLSHKLHVFGGFREMQYSYIGVCKVMELL